MIQAPIFHVNGDDPEAVVRVARLAFEYRQAFNKDVVIDMVCYRRRGHNEGDDPSMTNPQMYEIIDSKRSVRKLYTEELIGRGDITVEDAEELLRDYQAQLETGLQGHPRRRRRHRAELNRPRREERAGAGGRHRHRRATWSSAVGEAHINLPEGFTPHKRIQQLLDRRAKMSVEGDIDWGFGEIIAFGSLLHDGRHRPARRPGLAARHVRPAARLDRRRRDRRRLPAAEVAHRRRRPLPVLRARLAAQRVRGDGLRVRLLGGEHRTRWSPGRPSSATSSTAPSRSSTSSSPPAR